MLTVGPCDSSTVCQAGGRGVGGLGGERVGPGGVLLPFALRKPRKYPSVKHFTSRTARHYPGQNFSPFLEPHCQTLYLFDICHTTVRR
jgi:hypothetical protein